MIGISFSTVKIGAVSEEHRGHAIISFAIKTIEFVFVLVLASIRFMSVRIYWIQVVDKYIILRQAK